MTNAPSALFEALNDYVDAGREALLVARKALGISELEARAITSISAEPGIRPSVLRECLGVTSAGVTTLVDRLVGRGILRRELDADDRRVNHIFLAVDLEVEPWVALRRFELEIQNAIRAEPVADAGGFAEMLSRITERARETA